MRYAYGMVVVVLSESDASASRVRRVFQCQLSAPSVMRPRERDAAYARRPSGGAAADERDRRLALSGSFRSSAVGWILDDDNERSPGRADS